MKRRQFFSSATAAAAGFAFAPIAWGQRSDRRRWRVGVIGHTKRGDYGHALDTMWLKLPETEIVAVADADAAGLTKAGKKLNGAREFADYREMLSEVKPEIVAICPRHVDQHAEMVQAATAAGVRGIYIEKPFCRTPAEADVIVEACRKQDVKLAVAHRNRWHPCLPAVKQAVEDGAIGQLLEVRGRGKEDTRGGALDLWVLGSHVLNLVHYFAGNPLACAAVVLKGNQPVTREDVVQGAEGVGPLAGDRVHARFEMEKGVPAYFDSIRSAGVAAARFGLQLIGTKGLIDFRIDTHPLAHFVPGNPFQPGAEARPWIPISSAGIGKPETIPQVEQSVANHVLAGRDLIAAIEEKRPTLCSAEDGRVIVELINAVFASHVQHGARVPFPLAARENAFGRW